LTKYFVKSNSILESLCAAEGTLAFHTVAHHNSFKSMDYTSKLLREMFNDSEEQIEYQVLVRTKTEAIVNSVLAPHAVLEVIKSLDGIPFCGVSTDHVTMVLLRYF
jgi:hypothetical protein